MRKLIIIIVYAFSTHLSASDIDTLLILQTTDVHGNIYPYNYFQDEPDNSLGLAKVATRVKEYRQKHKNIILVDSGDLLQGTPLTWYFNKHELHLTHPMIFTMNKMGYDAFAVGNHDIEQGIEVYSKAEKESEFPWLAANAVLENGSSYFKPFTIIERGGIKVGFLGLTTPGIPLWLDKSLYPGIEWQDMVQTASKYSKELKSKSDIMIGLFHAGFNENYSKERTDATGIPNENASGLVAKSVVGFDAIFAGHSHNASSSESKFEHKMESKNDPLLINAGSWARNLAVLEVVLQRDDQEQWQPIKKAAWIESMLDVIPDQEILDATQYYHNQTLKYIREKVGESTGLISAQDAYFKDTPLLELINKAQIDYTGADISFAASFNSRLKLDAGDILVKDIYGMYYYENYLYVMEMSGQQIKDFLEFSARFFKLVDGVIVTDKAIPGFNYDMAEGLSYTIDVGKPVAERVVNLKNLDGSHFDLNKIYKVALNSYRASGGGGHIIAAGAQNNKIIFKSTEEMRNILAAYIQKLGIIKPTVDNNWKLLK